MQRKPFKSQKVGPWVEGMNNRLPSISVPVTLLRNAVNVDIDNTGRVRSRKGYTKVASAVAPHSLFSCPLGTFFVEGKELKTIDINNNINIIYNNISGLTCYEYFNNEVYFSDNIVIKKIKSDLTVVDLGITVDTEISVLAGDNVVKVDIHNPPLPGSIIKVYRGRLYVIQGNVVWYSEPYSFDRFKVYENYLQFPNDITVFEPVTNGIWCVSDQTYFLQGVNPAEFIAVPQLNYGAIARTSVKVPNTNDVMWMSQRGACLGDQDGNVTNLQEKNIAINPGTVGAAFIKEQDGYRQYISTYAPSGTTTMAAKDWMDFEVIRKTN